MINEEILFENVKKIYKMIAHSAMKAGRNPEDIRLISVTKNVDSAVIMKALNIGLREFGENRVQEAQKKIISNELKSTMERIQWHMIGNLQKNKAKVAVELFDMIHSVDSIEVAEEINKQAEKLNKQQKILIQVKLSDEMAKHGISKDKLNELIECIKHRQNLHILGLMTIPPFFDDPEMARPYFRELKRIRDDAEGAGVDLPELSMGMSNDFEVAIEEGATMVRVGTAIFGEREY